MKLKLLLFMFLFAGILNAQEDTIRTLIISEAHLGGNGRNFVEITNMGTEAVQLSNFEVGKASDNRYLTSGMRLPERMLEPGESFFIAEVHDFSGARARALGLENYTPPPPSEIMQIADVQIHVSDYDWNNNPLGISMALQKYDSVSPYNPVSMWFGRQAVYIEQHFANGDSAVIDQVMGVWDTEVSGVEGAFRNRSMATDAADATNPGSYDVAGYAHAGSFAILIRKFGVKEGNLEFVRGNSEDDSEWIALDNISAIANRAQPWTYGNHGPYTLDENTLEPTMSGIEVDFPNKIITVPWGLRRIDDIMLNMEKKPGIFWKYIVSPVLGDSLSFGIQEGDSLLVVVAGEEAHRATFSIQVEDPKTSDNSVIPMMNEGMNFAYYFNNLNLEWPQVTRNESGIDTITGSGSSIVNPGLPFALRGDSLLDRLEKPANATWEFVPVDGNENRPDLVNGDKLKVIAEDGSVKEYFIQVSVDVGNDNARLSSITWPDIPDPELFGFVYGWTGDTIPNFMPNSVKYQVKLPFDVKNVPATVAKTQNLNAKVETSRALYLDGTQEQRTTTYAVTATDDTTITTYSVEWQREKDPQFVQPYSAEPFVSEMVLREYFDNWYLEICNPGNQPLDLSDYMIVAGMTSNPADAIQFNPENWAQRYRKYVPGKKWVDEASWASNRGFLVPAPDAAVNPIVDGGDVFCLGIPRANGTWGFANLGWSMDDWPGAVGGKYGQSDVNFFEGWGNPWGEPVANGYTPIAKTSYGQYQYVFKILNDSVKNGTKAATDPNDFELIEAIGNVEGGDVLWGYEGKPGGHNFASVTRKPEFNQPNPILEDSFGDSPETSEWVISTRETSGITGWPTSWILTAMIDYGRHYFIPSTDYMSTIASRVYKVSEGYTLEEIRGLVTGVNVSTFLGNIIKLNENQTLVVKSTTEGTDLAMDALISLNDTLVVTSADGERTTKYVLEVSEEGLSSNAVLTSVLYTIDVDVEPKSASEDNAVPGSGTVSDFEYGTTLRTLLRNITVPSGANLSVIDKEGAFVPLKRLNFDTAYVDVIVNTNTLLEVIAEDGVTTINYELAPSTSQNDAFITSDYFNVIQSERLVEYVPWGISVSNLLSKVAPSLGATLKVVDKSGLDRTHGGIALDDKILVTSANGNVTNVYHLSMLSTESVPEATYLAYVLSNIYVVDQVDYVIAGPTGTTLLSEFYSRITAARGATAVVVDAEGNEKTSGDLDDGDMVKVTSADGKMEVMYTLDLDLTSTDLVNSGQINLYPNPTSGKINITGVTPGGRIQVFNSLGAAIRDINIQGNLETVSLDDQPAGMYLIVIRDKTKMVGRYKVMRR
jgi:hypothetical protein